MREKLNHNPMAQVAVVGVLVLAAAFMLLKGGGSSEGSAAASSSPSAASGGATSGSAESVSGSEGGEASTSSASAGATGATGEAGAVGQAAASPALPVSVPAPRLPAKVSEAYEANKTVILLIVHPGGIEDRIVTGAVDRLKSDPGLAVFVVPAKQISRYAAITVGLEVEQVPALIVLRPRHLSGGAPQASVSYGFQTPQSVVQAVHDATYKGPEISYHPN